MPKKSKELLRRELEYEKNKKFILEKIQLIKELTGEDLDITENEIESRARTGDRYSIEKGNFFNFADFRNVEQIEALYNYVDDYYIVKNVSKIIGEAPYYFDDYQCSKAIKNLQVQGEQMKKLHEKSLEKDLEKRIELNSKNIKEHLEDPKLTGDEFTKAMTSDLVELRILEDAKNGKIKLKDEDLTDNGMKKLVTEKTKDYKEIPKMLENSYPEDIRNYVDKHTSKKASNIELDEEMIAIKGEILLGLNQKHLLKGKEIKTLKNNLIKLYLLDGAKKGEIELNKEDLEPNKFTDRVDKIAKDYPEFDLMIKDGGFHSIRRYLDSPYEGLEEIINNQKEGVKFSDIENAKTNSEIDEYKKVKYDLRKAQVSDWLQNRADQMAAKFSEGKEKSDKDLAMLMVVQGLQRKVEEKKLGFAEMESFLNPDLINKNAERLVNDPDFKTISKSHLKNDFNNLKSGKVFDALVQERRKSISSENNASYDKHRQSVKEYNLAAKKANEEYFTSKEGRLEAKFNAFNNLSSVKEKEAFLEREFGFTDLRHADRFDPAVRNKLTKAQKFIDQANAKRLLETPPEKRESFLKQIGEDDGYNSRVMQEAKLMKEKQEKRIKDFNDKHKIVKEEVKPDDPYLGL